MFWNIIGIIFILLGGICLWGIHKKKSFQGDKLGTGITVYFLIWGLTLLLAGFINDANQIVILVLGFGVLSTAAGIQNIYATFICRLKTQGIYCGYIIRGRQANPVFEYWVGGERFHVQSAELINQSALKKRFTESVSYDIFVDEKHPGTFVTERRVGFSDISFILAGLFLVFSGLSL